MDSFPREIYSLITCQLSQKQWMRWALVHRESNKIVFPSVQNLTIQDNEVISDSMPINCIRRWVHLFSEIKTLDCTEFSSIGIQHNYETLRFLISRPITLFCRRIVLQKLGHDLILPRLLSLYLDHHTFGSEELNSNIRTPLLETLNNVNSEDNLMFITQPLIHLKLIKIIFETQDSALNWIRAISKLCSIEIDITLRFFRWDEEPGMPQAATLLATEISRCSNITAITLRTLYSSSAYLLTFTKVLSRLGKPIKCMDITTDGPMLSLVDIMEDHSNSLDNLSVTSSVEIHIEKQPPQMRHLLSLDLENLEIGWRIIGNRRVTIPIVLELPFLNKLVLRGICGGHISSKSQFPSLDSFQSKGMVSIRGLIKSIKTTSEKLRTVVVSHPRDVFIPKSLETLVIGYKKSRFGSDPLGEANVSLLDIITGLTFVNPPLRCITIDFSGVSKLIDSDLDILRRKFPSAAICINT